MDRSNAAHDLQRLLDVLVSTQQDLSQGLMPRAARITGTSEQLARVISQVEAAIHTTQSLLAEQIATARRSAPSGPPASC